MDNNTPVISAKNLNLWYGDFKALKSISLDVGGTTTDIAFWENGLPLMARKGATVAGYPTAVRAFHMRSIGIGGDSLSRWLKAWMQWHRHRRMIFYRGEVHSA